MTQFFTRAPDNPSTGSPAYAQSVLQFYYQNFLSGLVEINTLTDQFVIFISDGGLVASYRYEDGGYHSSSVDKISHYWSSGEADIRSVTLPRQAVRSAREGIEWFPPTRSWNLHSVEIPAYLNNFHRQAFDGILHILWDRCEGFLTLRNGNLVLNDTIYSSGSEVFAGLEAYKLLLSEKNQACRLSCYSGRSNSLAYQQFLLRLAVSTWLGYVLQRYLQLVGRNLLNALAGEINGFTRSKSCYIQVGGDSLEDTHIFQSIEACLQTYQVIMKAIALHMGKVIGTGLSHSIFKESFQKLLTSEQQVLTHYALLPALTASYRLV